MKLIAIAALFAISICSVAKAECNQYGFDREYYLSRNPDVAASGMDARIHYINYGWKEGRDPNAYFSTRGYLQANPDVAAAGINPLEHYICYGLIEGRKPIPPQVNIADPLYYMAQSRFCDGNPATPLRALDTINCKLFDAAREQVVYSFITNERGTISAMSFSPWGPWIEPATDPICQPEIRPFRCSDGGDQYVIDGDTIRAPATRDGGTPYDKWLVGSKCGAGRNGGWLLFRTDAAEEWREVVAKLSETSDPDACPPLGEAYTRYARRVIAAPRIGQVDTIVTEHYSHSTEAASTHMERMMFGRGWGRWAWMAFARQPSPHDVARYCPDFGWNELPGWYLTVCRIATNVEPSSGNLTGAQLWFPRRR